jgi:hypothetical protein
LPTIGAICTSGYLFTYPLFSLKVNRQGLSSSTWRTMAHNNGETLSIAPCCGCRSSAIGNTLFDAIVELDYPAGTLPARA